jgi:uncharacterized protein YoxC
MNLQVGARVIGVFSLLLSAISGILLVIYLSSDFDEIIKEISEKDDQMIQKLESQTFGTSVVLVKY